jgi:hypothetical protein
MNKQTKLLEAYWDVELGEAKIKYAKHFDDYDWTVKTDALVDVGRELKDKYVSLVSSILEKVVIYE